MEALKQTNANLLLQVNENSSLRDKIKWFEEEIDKKSTTKENSNRKRSSDLTSLNRVSTDNEVEKNLRSALAEHELNLKQKEKIIEKLHSSYSEIMDELVKVKSQCESLECENKNLSSIGSQSAEKSDDKDQTIKKMQITYTQIMNDLNIARSQCSVYEKDLANSKNQCIALEKQVIELSSSAALKANNLEDKDRIIEKMQKSYSKAMEELVKAKSQCAALEKQITESSSTATHNANAIEEKASEIEKMRARYYEVQDELARARSQCSTYETEIAKLSSNAGLSEDYKELLSENSLLKERISWFEKVNEELKDDVKNVNSELKEVTKENKELYAAQRELLESQSFHNLSNLQQETSKGPNDREVEELNETIKGLKSNIQEAEKDYESRITKQRLEITELLHGKQLLETDIAHFKSENDRLREERDSLVEHSRREVDEAKNAFMNERHQSGLLKLKINERSNALETREETIKRLEERVKFLEKEKDKNIKATKDALEKVDPLVALCDEREKEVDVLSKKVDELTIKLKDFESTSDILKKEKM